MAKNEKHGEAKNGKQTPEYFVWSGLRRRCNLVTAKDYPRYGGRGIKVCERWDDFRNFLADMGRRPSKKHQIDRIDSKGNYEPGNCRWVTSKENMDNRSVTKMITFRGETMTGPDWSRRLGLGRDGVGNRLRNGWPLEQALTLGRAKRGERR